MKRRSFLATGGALTVLFASGCSLPVIPKRPVATIEDASAWIRYSNGHYDLFLPRAEIGQNISTALKQIACEELDIDWDDLQLRLPTTNHIQRVRATVGSESIKDFALPLAQACATLREELAAGKLVGELVARDIPANELRTFGGAASAGLTKEKRYVGSTPKLEQAEAIVRGLPLYASDIRLSDMAFGRVLRAPASSELRSSPRAWDAAAARRIKGFIGIVEDPLFEQGRSLGLGVLAATPGALDRISEALAVRWDVEGSFDQSTVNIAIDIDRRLAGGALSHEVYGDSLDPVAEWDVDLRIDVPVAAHLAMEPRVAVAQFTGAKALQLWAGTQDAFYARDVLSKRLALSPEDVSVQAMRVGGAFGGKTICTVELEAAVLARAAKQPVKVQWTRAQEMHCGFHRPASSHRIRVSLRDGAIDQWWHAFASGHIIFTNAGFPPWLQNLADFVGDMGVARGADLPYQARLRRVEFDQVRLPILTGPWRGLGAGPNHLAKESAIDECAVLLKQDPLQFRLRHLKDPRLIRVLQQTAEAAAWSEAPAAAKAHNVRSGRGIACGAYKESGYAAVVAEVQVDATGRVHVTSLICSHDCGLVINPDQVKAQCEGNLIWGMGMVLTDELPIDVRMVGASNFDRALMPRMTAIPRLQTHLVEDDSPPGGAGETVIVAAAGAIANAIRHATGVRVGRFPVVAENLKMHSA
ncbi:Isoquinoline 1-oxidoreductase [Hydrogenophaga crassostreae]|uniref:Isoquinoline 1-oxidoreductase n=1 Tax=Hydrogenophaga crassostreae TaxID=1763535 RepID=A0A167HXG6_9BURK|nr:molybdopterin cofactor-binding domain-containing protein [Hydrogenophaga crassostreae]AOW13571.1 Isoquinoline 1-oxidoreductase [Hydrogenophaga crassostreae]OAD41865.1 Isoquinoline 1-oxidoreductase [Hydrogenophaga crassostreae]